jgi:hypothetical protein
MEIGQLTDIQFAAVYDKLITKIKLDPIANFISASGFMDLELFPAQEVILKVIFGKTLDYHKKKSINMEGRTTTGGFRLSSKQMTEVQIYEFMTESEYDPKSLRMLKINKVNLICGRRSGKTLLAAVIAIYCAISTNWQPFLRKTPFATVLIMSHSREFSDEVLEVLRSLIETSEILRRLINNEKKNTSATMNLKIPWSSNDKVQYSRVQIKVAAASSKTTRGVAACAVLCDEISYWNNAETMTETDEKIMRAVRPAMKQFGDHAMLIKLSSPSLKQGVLYSEYKAHKDGTLPKSYAVFKAPTWVMNSILPSKELAEEFELNPEAFDVEYRANFTDSLSSFIVPEYIEMGVLKRVHMQPPEAELVRYTAAIDAAYKGDAFTFTVCGYSNGRLRQYLIKGWQGTKLKPVSSYEVAEFIRNICKVYNIDEVAADQYSFQPLREIFGTYGVSLKEYVFTPAFKKKIYFNLKKLVHSQQIDLLDHETQTRELKELVVEQGQSGLIKISHPVGGTDDYADSLAVSAFLATQELGQGTFEVVDGAAGQTYGISTDNSGRAFRAPSTDQLVNSGHLSGNINDNSAMFIRHPKTGKVMLKVDYEEEGDETDENSQFLF